MYALATFVPAFLVRHHGLGVRDAGALSGLMFGVFGGLGIMLGGWAGDRLAERTGRSRLMVSAWALALSVPLMVLFLAQPPGSVGAALAFVCPALLLVYFYYAPAYATIQDVVEPSRRAIAMALYFCAMYLLGASLGPVGTGILSDRLAARAAAAAGVGQVTETFRAQGLHQAMFIVPFLTVLLAVTVWAAARSAVRDRHALTDWMREAQTPGSDGGRQRQAS
jgi:MFS family permease